VPDRNGKLADVVSVNDTADGYVNDKSHFGGIIGRFGNRIAHAQFVLDARPIPSPRTTVRTLSTGASKASTKPSGPPRRCPAKDWRSLELSYLSKDGDEGFPGNLKVTVTYTWTDANALQIEYSATTDKKNRLNLTNHS